MESVESTGKTGERQGSPAPMARRAETFDIRRTAGRRPMVLLFMPDLETPECRSYLQAFEHNRAEYERLEAAVVVVTLGEVPHSAGLPDLPVLSHGEAVFRGYGLPKGEEAAPAVVIVDRYGMVEASFTGETCADLPAEARVALRLQGAESACPECGVAEGRWQR